MSTMAYTVYGQQLFSTTDSTALIDMSYKFLPSYNGADLNIKEVSLYKSFDFGKHEIGFGGIYNHSSINIEELDKPAVYDVYEQLHYIQFSAVYKYALDSDWELNAELAPAIASTLNADITHDSFVLSGYFGFKKSLGSEDTSSYMRFGIGYGVLLGKPQWYPVLTYFKSVNSQLSFELGFPKTAAYYKINTQNSIDFSISPQSLYAYNRIDVNGGEYSDSYMEFQALKLGLGYTFNFDDDWSAYFNLGYLTKSSFKVEGASENLHNFGKDDGLFLGLNIQFGG